MGTTALLHPQRKVCRGFSAGFEPTNLGSSGKYANYYTNEDNNATGYYVRYQMLHSVLI
jgi:hypothetical protein